MVSNPVKINVICVRINSVPRWAGERSAAAPRIARRSGSTARSPRRASRAPRHSPAPTGSHQRCTRTAARALQVAQHSAGTNARWCFLTAALPLLLLLLLLLLVTARQRNPHVCREGARTERSIDYGKAPGPGPLACGGLGRDRGARVIDAVTRHHQQAHSQQQRGEEMQEAARAVDAGRLQAARSQRLRQQEAATVAAGGGRRRRWRCRRASSSTCGGSDCIHPI